MNFYDLLKHSCLLVGDNETGKTRAVKSLMGTNDFSSIMINSCVSLFHAELPISLDSEIKSLFHELGNKPFNQIGCTVWDCKGQIKNFNYFIMMNHISTVVIFCNLQNTVSCDRIKYWKQIVDKYIRGIQIIVVGTKNTEIQEKDLSSSNKRKSKDSDPFDTEFVEDERDELERSNSSSNKRVNKKLIEKNKLRILQWCVENEDIPFFEVDLNCSDEIKRMFQSIFRDKLYKALVYLKQSKRQLGVSD